MLRIGLTGPSGAGKSIVAELFARFGVPSVDTDAVYHELLLPPSACLDELVAAFGKDILTPDGHLDRPALAALVFDPAHGERLERLNGITHRHILDRVRVLCLQYEADGVPAVLIDAPVLFESGFDRECDRTLAVLADPDVRLARIMARDGLTREAALSRINAQPSDGFYISRADAVLYDNHAPEDLLPDVRRMLGEWGVSA